MRDLLQFFYLPRFAMASLTALLELLTWLGWRSKRGSPLHTMRLWVLTALVALSGGVESWRRELIDSDGAWARTLASPSPQHEALASYRAKVLRWLSGGIDELPPLITIPGTIPPTTKIVTVQASGGGGGGCG